MKIENKSLISWDLDFKPRLNIVINHIASSKPKANYQCWYIWTSNQQKKYYLCTSFIKIENKSSIFSDFDFKQMTNIVINHLTSSKQKANYQCWYIWTSNQQKSIYLFVHFFLPNWKWGFNFFRFRFQTNGEHCNQSSYVIKTEGQLPV